ncbi:MAG: cytochrome b/b6 domain-containing protein [Deltaproteobacteria bacterium]|nr:cytochrome b/b6 domain-containing protein [Deltaproteobacteria bacterium]
MTGEPFSLPTFTTADYNYYRLDDRIFFAFIVAALIFCVVHAARRAFRQPQPAESPGKENDLGPIKEDILRHTLFQRIYHWSNALAVIILIVSGWLLYQPRGFLSPDSNPSFWFSWHQWGTALLLVSLIFHVIYESFLARGPNPMVVDRGELKKLSAIFKNFFGLSKFYPRPAKYHPGQIFFHWAVTGNLLALILSGFVIWKPFRDFLPLSFFGLGWEFIFYNRLLHGLFSATLIASLIGHIYFALFIKKNWTETKSMVTGRISLQAYLESHSRLD